MDLTTLNECVWAGTDIRLLFRATPRHFSTLHNSIERLMKRPLRLSRRCAMDEINMLVKLLCKALPAGSEWERSSQGMSHFPIHSF